MDAQTFKITIDPTSQKVKPSKYQFGIITNNLTVITAVTINQCATIFTQPFGYTWTGSLFSGNLSGENWLEQNVIGLDFDKGTIATDEVIERFSKLEIKPQLWYSTLSDSDTLRKFRFVLFLDSPITNNLIREKIMEALLKLFPEADSKCKNASRFFLGGKESKVLGNEPINLERLMNILLINLITNDHGKTRRITPNLVNALVNVKSVPECKLLCYNNRNIHFKTKSTKQKTTYLEGGEVIDIEQARKKVRILDEFLNGEWLYHDQLFGLATNLIYIRGGRKLMQTTMEKFNNEGKTFYTDNNFNILTYLKKVNYPIQPVFSFSEFEEDKDTYDIISATRDVRGLIEELELITRIPLKIAEATFKSTFAEIMEDCNNDKINLFILPTAIGKTESLLNLENIIIAAPANKLKDEISSRMNVKYVSTPETPKFDDEDLNKKLLYYYTIGLPNKATQILYNITDDKNVNKYSTKDIDNASGYLKKLNESYYSNDTVLTTHPRIIHSEFQNNTIVFDEDPLKTLIDIKHVHISDIQKLDNKTMLLNNDLVNVIDFLLKCSPSEIYKTPSFNVDIEALTDKITLSDIASNVFEIFNSSYLIRDAMNTDLVHYVVKRSLPKNKKICIMSATAPKYIYEKLFGERLNLINISDVEQIGKVVQYTNRSCSRNSLERYVKDISDKVGDLPVITFKSFGKDFQNPVTDMYFGNCSGYDTMKGKDIAVVGTPHRNNVEYMLTAKVLGFEFKQEETGMKFQKIEYNGFKFKLNCYLNEELRKIQLSLIESDLIQAVGRARTLRTNARVDLYSNFPLRISNEFLY